MRHRRALLAATAVVAVGCAGSTRESSDTDAPSPTVTTVDEAEDVEEKSDPSPEDEPSFEHDQLDEEPDGARPPPAADDLGLELRTDVVDGPGGFSVETRGPFAVWWDPDVPEVSETIPELFDLLLGVEADATQQLGFGALPTTEDGRYLNVYVHDSGEDGFPDFLGNGLGYSDEGVPFLSMPIGAHVDPTNVRHEGFHVFQATADYDIVDEDLDAVWFIEASAEWYQHSLSDDEPRAFISAGSVYATPHLALWHLPENGRADDPDDNDWLYGVRQYGMGSFLYYLTSVADVDRSLISAVYSRDISVRAQEFLFTEVGPDRLRSAFADWAAGTAAGFDYLADEQVDILLDELDFFTSPDEIRAHVSTLVDPGAVTVSPPRDLEPRSWAYNSILIENTEPSTYEVALRGSPTGSDGGTARFEARVVITDAADGVRYVEVPMSTATEGDVVVEVDGDAEIQIVVASVPENFGGTESYPYEVEISRT